jgi:transposase
MARREELTDEQWAILEPLIPERCVETTAVDGRKCMAIEPSSTA